MKRLIVCSAIALLFTSLSIARAAEPQPPEGFRALFNGKDLTGWHGLNPHKVAKLKGKELEQELKKEREEFAKHWKVEDGELVNAGTGPYACTDEELGDIELLVEYKTVPRADSGIYLRGTPQVQIWDTTPEGGKTGPNLFAEKGSGGLFNNPRISPGKNPLVHADKPFGEWNSFRIKQIGANTWVWLNDKLVVDGVPLSNYWNRREPLPAKGVIMLQTHGGEIRWRNIFVREIGAEEAAKTAKPE